MMSSSLVTVVMQGDIRTETPQAIQAVRRLMPKARLVLSTWNDDSARKLSSAVDQLVCSNDPGALPPFTFSESAEPNNLNRQLVTTQAGLEAACSDYVLKMRTDIVLTHLGFLEAGRWFENSNSGTTSPKLVVSTFYTRHPQGLSCYLFHVSDWFVFGRTSTVKKFFAAPLMSVAEARWFESHPHQATSTYAARRFRARYSPEQHITVHYARSLGYKTPTFLNDSSKHLRSEYCRFLRRECLVALPGQLGFQLNKYSDLEGSLYQRLDCVGYPDWQRVAKRKREEVPRLSGKNDMRYIPWIRPIAHLLRYPIVKSCVMGRGLFTGNSSR